MATVTNWVETISLGEGARGAVYPYVGTELYWLILAIVIWVGWHVITGISETEEHEELSNRAPGSEDHKQNVTNW